MCDCVRRKKSLEAVAAAALASRLASQPREGWSISGIFRSIFGIFFRGRSDATSGRQSSPPSRRPSRLSRKSSTATLRRRSSTRVVRKLSCPAVSTSKTKRTPNRMSSTTYICRKHSCISICDTPSRQPSVTRRRSTASLGKHSCLPIPPPPVAKVRKGPPKLPGSIPVKKHNCLDPSARPSSANGGGSGGAAAAKWMAIAGISLAFVAGLAKLVMTYMNTSSRCNPKKQKACA